MGAAVLAITVLAGVAVAVQAQSARAATSPWTTQLQDPAPGGPYSVACATSTDCVAVGAGSAVSTDGGSTWTVHALPSTITELGGVTCPTAGLCVAVGYGIELGLPDAVAATTTDGGLTWTAHPIGLTDADLRAVQCASATACVAVGAGLQGPDIQFGGIAVTSSDGGATWALSTLPPGVGELSGLSCPTSTACVAVGAPELAFTLIPSPTSPTGTVLTSSDGGATWSDGTVPSGDVFDAVSCVSSTACVAVGGSEVSTVPGLLAVAATSSDGGATWTTRTLPGGDVDLSGVSCPTASFCVAVGAQFLALQSFVVTSSNGGLSWTRHPPPSAVDEMNGVTCLTATDCLAVGSGASSGLVTRTTDGAATWSSSAVVMGEPGMSDVSCTSASDCVAVGQGSFYLAADGFGWGSGQIGTVATVDGGVTWMNGSVPATPGRTTSLLKVSCSTGVDCVAVGSSSGNPFEADPFPEGEVMATTDGSTWTAGTLPASVSVVNAVSCPTPTSCFAAGISFGSTSFTSTFLTSTDGGSHWSTVTGNAPPTLVGALSCSSTSSCTAVGIVPFFGAAVSLSTTDGGQHWTSHLIASTATASSISCPTPSDCVAVGASEDAYGEPTGGATLATTDGGAHWITGWVTVAPGGLTSVSCISVADCVATGYDAYDNPVLAVTTDGGRTWGGSPSPSAALELSGISCVAPTTCTVTGGLALTDGAFVARSDDPFPDPSASTASVSPTSVVSEHPVTYSSTVTPASGPGTPTGSVTFTAGSQLLCAAALIGGHAGCTTTNAPVGDVAVAAHYSGDGSYGASTATTTLQVAPTGYRMAASDGGVFAYGSASFHGSAGGRGLSAPVVGMVPTPDGRGYWLVAADGGVFTYGDAGYFGAPAGLHLSRPIVGMAATPDGRGYWLVGADGGVFAYGDAAFHGSAGNLVLSRPIVGMAATHDGRGYWLVAADGGVFTYGDATFHGSAAYLHLTRPVVGMAATPDGRGYWLVGADGGVFAYGDGGYFGAAGGLRLTQPVVGMMPTPDGNGYWLVGADGGVFTYGDAAFHGSATGATGGHPVVAISG